MLLFKFSSAFVVLLWWFSSCPSSSSSSSMMSMELIHVDSPLSPFYNASLSRSELVKRAIDRSALRHQSLVMYGSEVKSYDASMFPTGHYSYMAKFRMGTPTVSVTMLVDTGSDLVWTQCAPCFDDGCYEQTKELYNRDESTTYESIECDSEVCISAPIRPYCTPDEECGYHVGYGQGEKTSDGLLATESFIIKGANGPVSLTFGCGTHQVGAFKIVVSGVLGLSRSFISLVSQLGHDYMSYCLIPTQTNEPSLLQFGPTEGGSPSKEGTLFAKLKPQGSVPGYSTLYFTTLNGITVGGVCYFSDQGPLDFLIDNGSSAISLERSLYNKIEEALKLQIQARRCENCTMSRQQIKLCYIVSNPSPPLPSITLHMDGRNGDEVNLPLPSDNIFIDAGSLPGIGPVQCLFIIPTDTRVSILGNYAQIDFFIQFNLRDDEISFTPTSCYRDR